MVKARTIKVKSIKNKGILMIATIITTKNSNNNNNNNNDNQNL